MATTGNTALAYTQREEKAMQLDLRLPHSFEVEWLREMPAGQTARYYPANPAPESDDGLLLRFHPHQGAAWIGCFASGTGVTGTPSTVVSSPDPATAFVVARGAGYAVRPDSPESCDPLPVFPVLFVRVIPEQKLVVFGGQAALAVYGPQGLSWFKRVVQDELKVQRIGDRSIHFTGWDAAEGKTVEGCIDLGSGEQCR